MTQVAIIGAGRGGAALVEILCKDPLVTVVGIADTYSQAPGLDLARRCKIPAVTDYRQLLKKTVDLIIDVTGNPLVRDALEKDYPDVEVIGGLAAKFMWQLIEERIKSQVMTEALRNIYCFQNMVGQNEKMKEIYDLIPKIAQTNATVLIEGESGTGKELVAHSIHQYSKREDKPFIRVNCAALAEGLLESELFGHVRGAFTGAIAHKLGRFEMADGGTLFLDEIGDISPTTQVKLLRVVQEGEFEKVGDSRRMKVDVRLIAATNKNLKKAVERGEFREDLYYRLKVVPIALPPLRERKDDIPLLVDHFIGRFNGETGKKVNHVSSEAMKILTGYDYPGNIRELENIIENAMIFVTRDSLGAEHLQKDIQRPQTETIEKKPEKKDPLQVGEKKIILSVLEQTDWNYKKTAERLNMSRTTLWRKLKGYSLSKPEGVPK